MPCEDTGLTVGLKPGVTIACGAQHCFGKRGGIGVEIRCEPNQSPNLLILRLPLYLG